MRKILAAEDELAINKMLCMNLGLMGYETVAMYDGGQAVDWLEEPQPQMLAILSPLAQKQGIRLKVHLGSRPFLGDSFPKEAYHRKGGAPFDALGGKGIRCREENLL